MNDKLSSHKFSEVYKQLGIDVSELGCIMLDTEPLDVVELVPGGKDDLYKSSDTKKFWIDGDVARNTAHLTLLYGLMKSGKEYKKQVDEVLSGWNATDLVIDHVDSFDNHYEDEDYFCIIAHIKVTDNLKEGNARLRFLPHIDTFPEYKPHVTLAYIKGNKVLRTKWINELGDALNGKTLKVKSAINYGGHSE